MQHTFTSPDGPIEVTLARNGEALELSGYSLKQHDRGRLLVTLPDGVKYIAHATKVGDVWWVHLNGRTYHWERIEPGSSSAHDEGGLVAPMPGKVLDVLVSEGQSVEAGTALMVLEAMKMEHRIVASTDGRVTQIHFQAGEQVAQGAVLLDLEETE